MSSGGQGELRSPYNPLLLFSLFSTARTSPSVMRGLAVPFNPLACCTQSSELYSSSLSFVQISPVLNRRGRTALFGQGELRTPSDSVVRSLSRAHSFVLRNLKRVQACELRTAKPPLRAQKARFILIKLKWRAVLSQQMSFKIKLIINFTMRSAEI